MLSVLSPDQLPKVDGNTFVRLVRRGLENVMAGDMSSVVVFECLEHVPGEALPNSSKEFHDFLYQRVKPTLEERLGMRSAELALQAVEKSLKSGPEQRSDSVKTTVRRESVEGPVGVLMLSDSTALAVRMRAALGGDRVGVAVASSLSQAATVSQRLMPQMFILDLDFLRENSYEEVVAFIRGLPASVSIVVWGSRQDAANKIGLLLRSHGRQPVGLSREVGIEPLLDMIRAQSW